MRDKYKRYVAASLCLLIFLEEIQTIKLKRTDFGKPIANDAHSFAFGKRGKFEDDSLNKNFDRREVNEDPQRYDLTLEYISTNIHDGRQHKRYAVQSLILVGSFLSHFSTAFFPNCKKAKANIETINTLQEQASEEKLQINLDWGKVASKEKYLQRLSTKLVLLKELIITMHEIKKDLISLVGRRVLNELRKRKQELKNQIGAANNVHVDSVKTKSKVRYELLKSLGFILILGNQIRMSIYIMMFGSKKQAAMQELKTSKTILKRLGKFAVAGLGVVLAAINIGLQYKQCQEQYKNTEAVVTKYNEVLRNFTKIKSSMTLFNSDIDRNYSQLWNDITSKNFTVFINEAIATANNSEKQTKKLKEAIADMNLFNDEISETKSNTSGTDYEKVDSLTARLLNGFLFANKHLNCFLKKIKIMESIKENCRKGFGKLETIWNISNRHFVDDEFERCLASHIDFEKNKTLTTIREMVNIEGGNQICLRNNKNIRKLVCQMFLNNKSPSSILSKMQQLSSDDVHYFISQCRISVDKRMKNDICMLKASINGVDVVVKTYSKFDRPILLSIWHNCPLSRAQRENICLTKQQMVSLVNIQDKYKNYNASDVKNVYAKCQQIITPVIKNMICYAISVKNLDLKNHFARLYGRETVSSFENDSSKCS